MWLPEALYQAAQHGRDEIRFYCGYGHAQVYAKGESDLAIVRRERDRLKQQLAEKDDLIIAQREARLAAEKQLTASRAAATKARKRTVAGVCPCCHRTFRQMALHMKAKHPGFKAEEVA
jgi:hypothetical protein